MTAVTAARDTQERELIENFYLTVKTGESIYEGTLCVLDTSGELNEATTGTSFVGGFIADETVVSAAAGAKIKVRSNVCVKLANGDTITNTSMGDAAYGFDNATVKKTATGLSACGSIIEVVSDGVWVQLTSVLNSGLAVANNLSDVGTVATARSNLGVDRQIVQLVDALDLIGGNAAEFRYVHVGPDCTITRLSSVLSGALTTADAVITADIGGTGVTGGVITITQAASAEDDVDFANPSALNAITEGDVLTLTVSGTQDAARFASISMELTIT